MKPGDLVQSNRKHGSIALVLEVLNQYRVRIMWCDTGEIDSGGKLFFVVISESR